MQVSFGGWKPWLITWKRRLDFWPAFKGALAAHEWAIWPFFLLLVIVFFLLCLVPVVTRSAYHLPFPNSFKVRVERGEQVDVFAGEFGIHLHWLRRISVGYVRSARSTAGSVATSAVTRMAHVGKAMMPASVALTW